MKPLKAKKFLGVAGGFCLLIPGLLFLHPFFADLALIKKCESLKTAGNLTIVCPINGAIFPPDLAPPAFRWSYEGPAPGTWLLSIRFDDGARLFAKVRQTYWRPSKKKWEEIKKRSLERTARGRIIGVEPGFRNRIACSGEFAFSTSKDSVINPLFYREVVLPFSDAVRDPSRIRWRFGSIAGETRPRVVLENLPVCGNCHSFSLDGKTLGMDVDYANDKGAYAITPVSRDMDLVPKNIITWSDYKREDKEPTFGLLSQVSPDGRFAVSTVKDRSVFVARPDLFFSQLFFPIQGILAVFSRESKTFSSLPGADDPGLVQSNPSWSPDGKFLVFARSPMYRLTRLRNKNEVLLSPEECSEFISRRVMFKYDLYRIPFNGGKGGAAEPLSGASGNGMSNFFARYSPDGRWIVFCKAESFMLLQPDSRLYIMPASGGAARLMRCNTNRMNSWHSWSSNSRWLVFSSKANSPYTQLFITHIDGQGNDAPPVLLENLIAPDRAANIPEFVYDPPHAIAGIHERFIDDVSLWRAGKAFEESGDMENAGAMYAQAIRQNPGNVKALISYAGYSAGKGNAAEALSGLDQAVRLEPGNALARIVAGNVYYAKGEYPEAIRLYAEALRLDPDNGYTRYNLGLSYSKEGKYPAALAHFSAALKLMPDDGLTRIELGITYSHLNRMSEAITEFKKGAAIFPNDTDAQHLLAEALVKAGKKAEAIGHCRAILPRFPESVQLRLYLAGLLRQEKRDEEARQLYQEAIRMRPDSREARDSLAKMGEK